MPLSGLLTTTDDDVLLGPAIVRVAATNWGVTRGNLRFSPNWELAHIDFDGRHAPVKGLTRKFYGEAELGFTFLDLGNASTGNQIAKVEANSSAASAGSPNVTTVTPEDGGALLTTYLTDFRMIWDRGIGSGTGRYFAVRFPCALVTSWNVSDNARDVAVVEATVVAIKDMASGDVQDAPYVFEYREALPAS